MLWYSTEPSQETVLLSTHNIKHRLWVLKRIISIRRFSFKYPQHMFPLSHKNIIQILHSEFLSYWNFAAVFRFCDKTLCII